MFKIYSIVLRYQTGIYIQNDFFGFELFHHRLVLPLRPFRYSVGFFPCNPKLFASGRINCAYQHSRRAAQYGSNQAVLYALHCEPTVLENYAHITGNYIVIDDNSQHSTRQSLQLVLCITRLNRAMRGEFKCCYCNSLRVHEQTVITTTIDPATLESLADADGSRRLLSGSSRYMCMNNPIQIGNISFSFSS